MSERWKEILDRGAEKLKEAGIEEAGLDAWYLFERAFHMDRVHFLMEQMREAGGEGFAARRQYFEELLAQRGRRIPLQHLLESQEFMGLTFYVNEDVLIPRQDTETLVEQVLAHHRDKKIKILDMCTGSGCIAVSLKKLGGYADVTGADLSPEALAVARRNGEAICGADGPVFVQSDLFAAVDGVYDVIASNPPYIPSQVIEGLEPEVRDYEPRGALDGGADGLIFYRRLAAECREHLTDGGSVYFEIGCEQAADVTGFLADAGYSEIEVIKDEPGLDRVVRAVYRYAGGLND